MTDHVVLTGHGSAAAVPDLARLSLRVESAAADVPAALAGCTRASAAVLEVLAGKDVGTTSVTLETDWRGDGRPSGYVAQQGLVVRLQDTAEVGAVVTACAEAAGDLLRVGGLEWSFSPDVAARLDRDAREAAWTDARAKAQQVAELSGRTLGPVLELSEGDPSTPYPRAMAAKMESDLPTVTGEESVSVALTVTWGLE